MATTWTRTIMITSAVLTCLMWVYLIPGAHGFFGIRKGGSARNKRSLGAKGELWMIGDDPSKISNAIAGTTVQGICNVTSPSLTSRTNFNSSNLVIKDFHGAALPAEAIVPISKTAVRFTIKNIQKSQYGKYKCYYQSELIYDRWIYVGDLEFIGGNLVVRGTTVKGVCNASKCDKCIFNAESETSSSKSDKSMSDFLVIKFQNHTDGTAIDIKKKHIRKISSNTIEFTIAKVHRSQFGHYSCVYMYNHTGRLIDSSTLYVGEPIVVSVGAGGTIGHGKVSVDAGTTVYGICNASHLSLLSTKTPQIDKSPTIYRVIYYNQTRHDLKITGKQIQIKLLSQDVIGFAIPHIKKSQCCAYICRRGPPNTGEIIGTMWLQVGVKPRTPSLNLTNQDAVLVYNWENMAINISPTIKEQNAYTHDKRDTAVRLLTKCQIWYNWSVAVNGGSCSTSMPFTKCDMKTNSTTCLVPRGSYRDLSGRKPPNYICIKAECWNKAFGNSSDVFKVDLAQRVKPAPVSFSFANLTGPRSVTVKWQNGHPTYELVSTVTFSATNFDHKRTIENLSSTSLDVKDLIPHGEYTVQITARPRYAGFESDPTSAAVIMPPDVPAENPQLIAKDIVQYDGEKKVTLYWKSIPEIKRNGNILIEVTIGIETSDVHKRSLPTTYRLDGNQTSYSDVFKDDKSYFIELETVSTYLGRNTALQPTTLHIKKGNGVSAPFRSVEAVKDKDSNYVNVTWAFPSSMVAKNVKNVTIMYCEQGQDKECDKTAPLKTLTVNATVGLVRVDSNKVYKIGVTTGKPGLVMWSPCIYKQGEVPGVGPHLNLRLELKKVEVQVKKYLCEETLAKVIRVEGQLCETADKKTCLGESRAINISEGEFSIPHMYPVDNPGSHYMVRALAVSSAGRSPESHEFIFVAATGEIADETIGIIVGGFVLLVASVIVIILAIRKYKETKRLLNVRRTPAAPGLDDPNEDSSDEYDVRIQPENSYESLLSNQEVQVVVRDPETPPPLPMPRDINQRNPSNTSGGATNSSGFNSGAMVANMSAEESDDEGSGMVGYAPGVVNIAPKNQSIQMSFLKNDSACSVPSSSGDITVEVEDGESGSDPPRVISDEAETELNSGDSFDANTSRGTEDLGSESAAGSSRDYAVATLPNEPPTHILPAIHDEFAIDVVPADTREKPSPENIADEHVYRRSGPRGLVS